MVLAAEMPDAAITWSNTDLGNGDRALVELSTPIPWKKIASGHVDAPDAVPDMTAAVEALPAAEAATTTPASP